MGVYIKGMEMPKSCSVCRLFGEYGCPFIGAVGYALTRGERNEDCPITEVPEPHGRLIDADALKEAFCGNCFADENPMECSEPCMDMRIILEAPTVIPASEEGE